MKRFQFQLEPVLNYKLQTLDALMIELNTVQAQVVAQQKLRDEAYGRLADFDAEFEEKKTRGLTSIEAMEYQACQRVLEQRALRENRELLRIQNEAERKRGEVVEARKETHSLEKLKQFRLGEYNTAAVKAEEKALDDLTAARRAVG